MESFTHKTATLELFKTLFTESEFRDWPHVGIVIQAYLRDAEDDLRDLLDWGRKRGTRFAVRLVKGAYWDFEKIKSRQNGWACPVFLQKPGERSQFRNNHSNFARERIDRDRGVWFAQRPQHRTRAGTGRPARNRSQPFRIPVALRNGRTGKARARRNGLSRSGILPGRRTTPRDVVSRSPIAREHFKRRISAREIF